MGNKERPENKKRRELIEHYSQLDHSMGPKKIVNCIKQDHGVEYSEDRVSQIRLRYLRSVGLLPEAVIGGKHGRGLLVPTSVKPSMAKQFIQEVNGQATQPVVSKIAKVEQPQGLPKIQGIADALEEFTRIVNLLGGKEAALRILNMLS